MAAPNNLFSINGARRQTSHQGGIMPSPGEPLPVARVLLNERTEDGHLLLRRWRSDWWTYVGPHWVPADPEAIRRWLYVRLEHAEYERLNQTTRQLEVKPWGPDKSKLDKVLDALAAPALIDRDAEAPRWLSTGDRATGYVPCSNGLVDVTTREIHPATPDYFGTVGIPLDYDPDAGEPGEWLKFLRSLWPATDDGPDAEQSIRLLRQWMAYVLSGRLDLQKALLVVGPPRCGKGTIARILRDLVGAANTSAPTLGGLAQNFGLESSIGKTLAIVGDARLGSAGSETVVERLLSITGQDTLTLDRKNKTAWTGTLQARVMILSNELPKFGDASGAIASRFLILRLEESFLGREDTDLEGRLRAEFPQILRWALEGLADLNEEKRFTETDAHKASMQDLYDLVSPISGFIRDVCDIDDPKATVPFSALYREYERWCDVHRRGAATGTARFSEALKSRLPTIKTNYRPVVNGVKAAANLVRGITVSPEWAERVSGDDEKFEPGKSWGRGW